MQHKVLIVDDDHDTHAYIADLLRMDGYAADCVHRSDTAQERIRRQPPDLLILDLHIERRYAGWLLLQELRADPATAKLPVVVATSDQEFVRQHQHEVRAQGGELLVKPFEPDALIKLIEAKLGSA